MANPSNAELRSLAEALPKNCSPYTRAYAEFRDKANPATVLSLLDELERAYQAVNSECQDWAREYEARMKVKAERDAALAELEAIKSSGWRNHSVNYARAEKCPQTLETAQAAWDRDQELIEEQRQQIAKDSQTINDLRQKLEASRKDAERLDRLDKECEAYGFEGIHEGNRWMIDGPFRTVRDAIDATMSQEASHA